MVQAGWTTYDSSPTEADGQLKVLEQQRWSRSNGSELSFFWLPNFCGYSSVIRHVRLRSTDFSTVKKIRQDSFRTNVFRSGGTPDVDPSAARTSQKWAPACSCRRLRFPALAMCETERHRGFPPEGDTPSARQPAPDSVLPPCVQP